MQCDQCEAPLRERVATKARPYHYELSGLENVWLVGIKVQTCAGCETELPIIPRMAELHRVIARSLLDLDRPLRGDEVRYLRKFAGYPAKTFAEMLDVRPEHLSRVENGKTATLGGSADRLARIVGALAIGREATGLVQAVLNAGKRSKKTKPQRQLIEAQGRRWAA